MKARLVSIGAVLGLVLAAAGCDGTEPVAVGETAWTRVSLVSESAEPILQVAVREGDRVAVGDVIVRQDPSILASRQAQAEAAERQARARLAELRRGPREEDIRAARAQLSGARSRLDNAGKQLQRTRNLLGRGLATPADLDNAVAERDSARAETHRLQAQLDALVSGTTREALDQAEAALAQAWARVRELALSRDRLTVRAPVAGRVDSLPFETGERPPAGATVAVLLVGERPYARVYVPEPYRASISPGDTVTVHVDGLDAPLRGRVRSVAGDPAFTPFFALTEHDRSRLSYLAEIDLPPDTPATIAAGIPVEVDLRPRGDEH